jgi:hypothetical protein
VNTARSTIGCSVRAYTGTYPPAVGRFELTVEARAPKYHPARHSLGRLGSLTIIRERARRLARCLSGWAICSGFGSSFRRTDSILPPCSRSFFSRRYRRVKGLTGFFKGTAPWGLSISAFVMRLSGHFSADRGHRTGYGNRHVWGISSCRSPRWGGPTTDPDIEPLTGRTPSKGDFDENLAELVAESFRAARPRRLGLSWRPGSALLAPLTPAGR